MSKPVPVRFTECFAACCRPFLAWMLFLIVLLLTSVGFSAGATEEAIESGRLYRVINVKSGHAMDVAGSSNNKGARLIQAEIDVRSKSQLWKVTRTNVGYEFVNLNSGKAIDVPRGDKNPGVAIQQWDAHRGDNQQWRINQYRGNFAIVSRASNLVVAVRGGSKESGTELIQELWTKNAAQMWKFQPVANQ